MPTLSRFDPSPPETLPLRRSPSGVPSRLDARSFAPTTELPFLTGFSSEIEPSPCASSSLLLFLFTLTSSNPPPLARSLVGDTDTLFLRIFGDCSSLNLDRGVAPLGELGRLFGAALPQGRRGDVSEPEGDVGATKDRLTEPSGDLGVGLWRCRARDDDLLPVGDVAMDLLTRAGVEIDLRRIGDVLPVGDVAFGEPVTGTGLPGSCFVGDEAREVWCEWATEGLRERLARLGSGEASRFETELEWRDFLGIILSVGSSPRERRPSSFGSGLCSSREGCLLLFAESRPL